MTHCSAEC